MNMGLGLSLLHLTLATLALEPAHEEFKKELEKTVPAASDAELNKKLALIEGMIQELEKQGSELRELQETNAKIQAENVKLEILAINKRLFEEKQQYLQIIKEVQKQNLDLQILNEKSTEAVKLEIAAIHERLLKEKEKHHEEMEKLKKAHAEAVKLEVLAVNERILEERKQHLNQIAALKNDLTLTNKKVSWLDERAQRKTAYQIGDLLAEAAFSGPEMETAPPPILPIFRYRPEIKKSAGYSGVEFLWWKAYEGALDYAIQGQEGSNPGNSQGIGAVGKLKSASFAWDPGYRLYMGYRFPPDFWEVEAIYTYYHSSHRNKVPYPKCYPPNTVTTGIVTTYPEQATVGTFLQDTDTPTALAKSSISLNYNMGDLLLARRLAITDALLLRAIFGVSGLWLDQHWKYNYLPGSFILNGVNEGLGSVVVGKENWKFSGGGMRLGIDMDWFAGKGFSILTEGSVALFFGSYSKLSFSKTNNHVAQTQTPLAPQVLGDLKIHDDRFSVHTRLRLMPAWGMRFDRLSFLFYIGYEINLFTNLQEVYRPASTSNRSIDERTTDFTYGLLGMQGLTTGLKFDF